jgi:mono/diheme cytochrome c family protein
MTPAFARALAVSAAALGTAIVAAGAAVYTCCSRFDASLAVVYDVPLRNVARSRDPAVLERGEHLVESIGGCAMAACHGADLGGGDVIRLGSLGVIAAPNITPAAIASAYTDAELARVLQHGLKRDGRSVRLMPSQDIDWLPDADVDAIVSYLRTLPAVHRPGVAVEILPAVKLLDRLYDVPVDTARRIDHAGIEPGPTPEPTAAYGAFLARACRECHGARLSGGPIPGLHPSMTTPLNLTPDRTGLAGWTFEDFDRVMRRGVRKNGASLSEYMPIDAWRHLDETEMRALWAYLASIPPIPFGQR